MARIIREYHEEPFIKPFVTFRWEGKKSDPITLDYTITLTDEFRGIPWKLIEVKRDLARHSITFIRKDVAFGVLAIITKIKEVLHQNFSLTKMRIIATLQIWGIKKNNFVGGA